jgi:hypothetical protein
MNNNSILYIQNATPSQLADAIFSFFRICPLNPRLQTTTKEELKEAVLKALGKRSSNATTKPPNQEEESYRKAPGSSSSRRGSGNRCGHDPLNPRQFTPPQHHRPRPKIIQEAIKRLGRYYWAPAEVFPVLNLVNGSKNQQRSERREACRLVKSFLLHYMDIKTLKVGIPQPDGSIMGISVAYIASALGMTAKRVQRAMSDLVKAGMVIVEQKKVQNGKSYLSYPAIRKISYSFFKALGLEKWLNRERKKREKAELAKEKEIGKSNKVLAHLSMAARGACAKLTRSTVQNNRPSQQSLEEARKRDIEELKRRAAERGEGPPPVPILI